MNASITERGRRRLIATAGATLLAATAGARAATNEVDRLDRSANLRARKPPDLLTVYTFGDSILDCGRYNVQGVHPGQLIVRNDDALFPEFRGRDLSSKGAARLVHCAVDGSTVVDLGTQSRQAPLGSSSRPSAAAEPANALALLTVGGNDLLQGLVADDGKGLLAFESALLGFLRSLPIRPVYIGNVYDPTFGDDSRNFMNVPATKARLNLGRMNATIAEAARRHGTLVDLHAHFLQGDSSWFTHTIEPSLVGAGEVRRAFLQAMRL